MQLTTLTVRRYDLWLVAITTGVILFFLLIAYNLTPLFQQNHGVGDVSYLLDSQNKWNKNSIVDIEPSNWLKVKNPVNLGMNPEPYWFTFTLSEQQTNGRSVLEVNYPLLDQLDILFINPRNRETLATYTLGDGQAFARRLISHESLLVPVPSSSAPISVYLRVQTTGSIKVPLRVWQESDFIEYTSRHNLLMGLFFGFLMAMGISNVFLFLTTRDKTFLVYSGYVFSLALTLASIQGIAYAYLWPSQVWFQGRAVAIFANAAIMFAVFFSHLLLQVRKHSKKASLMLKGAAWLFGFNIIVSLFLPYPYLIKIFLVLLSLVVVMTLMVGIWLALRGVVIARYYSFAWSILLISGFTASLDNLNIVSIPVPSNYLLMLGAVVETLLLALVLAISYGHNRDAVFNARERALSQEKEALEAKENLLSMQEQYQNDLEYKVQERTLELEIALRELSEANRELENLNTLDSLTGIRNRRHFDKRLQAEGRRSRREQTPLSLAVIDIDHFKKVNDDYGHDVGDICIRHVADILQGQLRRPSDDVCRYGGEEFAIILPNTDLEGATLVVESMREALAASTVDANGQSISMTISAGVSTAIITREDEEKKLFRQADQLLYAAKEGGRNQVRAEPLISDND